ncbi:MAG: hypothetical protein JNM85_03565 [Chthonomonas sp.]|nr:hypothetical protein [Chthonomonas sp.]
MVEFLTRILGGGALVALSFRGIGLPFEWAWRIGAIYASFALVVAIAQKRSLRGPGLSLLLAGIDAGLIALTLARQDLLLPFGFLVLIPCAHATIRHRIHPAMMAPVCAALFYAATLVARTPLEPQLAMLQSGAIFLLVLIACRPAPAITQASETPALAPEPITESAPTLDEDLARALIDLRENYRRLRDHTQTLERRSRRDRVSMQVLEAAFGTGDRLQQRLTDKLREITGASGVTLYTVAQMREVLSVVATSGDQPDRAQTSVVPLTGNLSEVSLRSQVDLWLRSVKSPAMQLISRSLVLKDRGRILGVLCLHDSNPNHLQQAYDLAEEALPILSRFVREELESDVLRRRLAETETLYAIASITTGSDSTVHLAARVVREMWTTLGLDHLAIHFLDDGDSVCAAREGAAASLVEAIQFGDSQGMHAWLEAGAPEVAMFDTTEDDQIDRKIALQKRVGSFALIPMRWSEGPIGFITAATHRSGGIDIPQLERLRMIGAELTQAVGRIEARSTAEGLVTPREFTEHMNAKPDGCLVYLEPIRREEIVAEYGPPSYEHATTAFARRLRASLPPGGLLCRRGEGDYVVFLRDVAEPFARTWANEATATAAMTAVTTPDGRARIPLAFKAKVSVQKGNEKSPPQERQIIAMSPYEEAQT